MTEVDTFVSGLAERRGQAPAAIGEDTDLVDAGVLDSLALVELVAFLGDRVPLADDLDIAQVRSLRAIRAVLDGRGPR